ncbi:MAG: VanZ family protein [Planctomycetes bacterium]|nr:VanZ family protein [Planctomycetota bacterium]
MRALRAGLVRLCDLWLRLPGAVRVVGPFAVMGVLWWTSSQTPKPTAPNAFKAFLHNGAHIIAYAGLGGAWLMALLPGPGGGLPAATRRVCITAVVFAVLYGGVDEVHQMYVPGRTSSLWDVASDASGAAIAVTLVLWAFRGGARLARRLGLLLVVALLCVLAATFLPG